MEECHVVKGVNRNTLDVKIINMMYLSELGTCMPEERLSLQILENQRKQSKPKF